MEMEEYHEDIEFKKKQKKELEKLVKEITDEAKKVVEDYVKNPSEMSGSYHYINENSPILKKKKKNVD